MPRRSPVKPGGIVKLRSPRNWSPSSRSASGWKSRRRRRSGRGAGGEARREGTDHARAGRCRSGPSRGRRLGRALVGQRVVPGDEAGRRPDRSRSGRRRHQAAVRGEQMQLEVVEGHLRQVFEVDRDLTGDRVRPDRADQLRVDAEAVATRKRRYWSPASVRRCRRALEAARPAPGCRREGADLGAVRAVPGPRCRSWPARRCRRSGRRPHPG